MAVQVHIYRGKAKDGDREDLVAFNAALNRFWKLADGLAEAQTRDQIKVQAQKIAAVKTALEEVMAKAR